MTRSCFPVRAAIDFAINAATSSSHAFILAGRAFTERSLPLFAPYLCSDVTGLGVSAAMSFRVAALGAGAH
jgi:hypothetical protein